MTSRLRIDLLSDDHDCDTCGWTSATGANVYINDKLILELIPSAHCSGSDNYEDEDIYERILNHLGYEVKYDDISYDESVVSDFKYKILIRREDSEYLSYCETCQSNPTKNISVYIDDKLIDPPNHGLCINCQYWNEEKEILRYLIEEILK